MAKRVGGGSRHIKEWSIGMNGPFVLDDGIEPAKKAHPVIMANRKVANPHSARASKSPQPKQNAERNNLFAAEQVNGTSNSSMSNGFSAQNSGQNIFGASQSFPPSNANSNNNAFADQPPSNASFPTPQQQQSQHASFPPQQPASPGIFSSMSGSTGAFNFNAKTMSNPFKDMSYNQTQEDGELMVKQLLRQKRSRNADSMEGRIDPHDYDGENAPQFTSPEGGRYAGPLNGNLALQDISNPFTIGQAQTAAADSEQSQNSSSQQESQQAAPQLGDAQNAQNNIFGQNNTQPQQSEQAASQSGASQDAQNNIFNQNSTQPQQSQQAAPQFDASQNAQSNMFEQNNTQPQQSQQVAPQFEASQNAQNNMFNQNNMQPQHSQQAASQFDASQNAQNNLFAQNNAQPQQSQQAAEYSHFGVSQSAPNNFFGQSNTQPQQSQQAADYSHFGVSQSAPNNFFGQNNAQPQQLQQAAEYSHFGVSQSAPNNFFGQSNTQPQQTDQASFNLFAQNNMQPQQTDQASFNLFAQNNMQSQQTNYGNSNIFGQMEQPLQFTQAFATSQPSLFQSTNTAQDSQASVNPFTRSTSDTSMASLSPSNTFGQTGFQTSQSSQSPPVPMPSPFQATNNLNPSPSNSPFQVGNTGGSFQVSSGGFQSSMFSTPSNQGGNQNLFQLGTPQANESPKPSPKLFGSSATPKAQSAASNAAPNVFKPSTPGSEQPSSSPKSTLEQPSNLFQSSTSASSQDAKSPATSNLFHAPTNNTEHPSSSKQQNPFVSVPSNVDGASESDSSNTRNFSAPPKPFASSAGPTSFGVSQQAQNPPKQTTQSSNLFASSTNAQSSNLSGPPSVSAQTSTPGKSSNVSQSTPATQPSNAASELEQTPSASSQTKMSSTTAGPSSQAPAPQASGSQKKALVGYLSLVSFNRSFIFALQQMDPNADLSPMFDAYRSELVKIQQNLPAATKRKADDDLPTATPKRSRPVEEPSTTPAHSPSKSQASNIIDDVLGQSTATDTPSKPAGSQASAPPVSSGFTPKPSTGFTPSNAFSGSTSGKAFQSNNIFGGSKPKPSSSQTENPSVFTPKPASANGGATGFVPKPSTPSASAPTGFVPKPSTPAASAPSGFVPKPSTPAASAPSGFMPKSSTPSASAPTGFMPKVTADSGTSGDFFAAFGKKAEKTAEEVKKRRKAEEFDSDEDDEAEWERKYDEEQRAKKLKTEEDAKKNKVEYQAGTGFVFKPAAGQNETTKVQSGSSVFKPTDKSSTPVNSTETPSKSSKPAATNLFQHLSDSAATDQSGDEGDDESDGRAAEDEVVESADARSNAGSNEKPSLTSGKSLLERSTRDDGRPAFNRDGTPTSTTPPGSATPTKGAALFGQSASLGSNLFGVKPPTAEDHTWKPDSPLKFASSTGSSGNAGNEDGTNVPKFNFTAPTPEKSKESPFKSSFATPSNYGSDGASDSEPRPFKGLFGSNNADPSPSLFQSKTPASFAGTPTKFNASGFTFGGPPKSDGLVAPSVLSRATTPGTDVTSANESAVDTDNEEAAPPEEQTDLTSLTAQEKQENDVIYEEGKAKLSQFVKEPKPAWEAKGTGPLRLLKNKDSGITRILMRASPSGRIVMNSRLLPTVEYKHKSKSMVQFATVDEAGKPQTWVLRTGKDENAAALAAAMEANKE